jgi:hypothetical protein
MRPPEFRFSMLPERITAGRALFHDRVDFGVVIP